MTFDQIDPLADVDCVYGEAGMRICGYTRGFVQSFCCHHGEGIPVEETGMST
jgi:hypothetical protein